MILDENYNAIRCRYHIFILKMNLIFNNKWFLALGKLLNKNTSNFRVKHIRLIKLFSLSHYKPESDYPQALSPVQGAPSTHDHDHYYH